MTPLVTCSKCGRQSAHPGPVGEFVAFACSCGHVSRDVVYEPKPSTEGETE